MLSRPKVNTFKRLGPTLNLRCLCNGTFVLIAVSHLTANLRKHTSEIHSLHSRWVCLNACKVRVSECFGHNCATAIKIDSETKPIL